MSRRSDIAEAGKFAGLAAAHWACYGEAWREVEAYRSRTDDILDDMSLNQEEFALCRATALKRARKYIRDAFGTPGKTLVPPNQGLAVALAERDIDAILQPHAPRR